MATTNGTGGDDSLRGTAGEENNIAGNDGNDTVVGRGKSDLLLGGKGDDVVKGGNGHDTLFGGAGDDILKGGNGKDTLSGDKGNNELHGGNGDDTFVINGALVGQSHSEIMDFDVGRQLRKMTYDDSIQLTNVEGKAVLFEQNPNGTVFLFVDGSKMATFNGSEGALSAVDLLAAMKIVGGEPGSVQVKINGGSGDDSFVGAPGVVNTIAGNGGNDIIVGRGKDDFLLGGGGDDELYGANGHDTLFGGGNSDLLVGGNGGDTLQGDNGNDTLTGGNGNDVFVFDDSDGTDVVTDFVPGEDRIELVDKSPFGDVYELDYDGINSTLEFGATYVTFLNAEVTDADITGAASA